MQQLSARQNDLLKEQLMTPNPKPPKPQRSQIQNPKHRQQEEWADVPLQLKPIMGSYCQKTHSKEGPSTLNVTLARRSWTPDP